MQPLITAFFERPANARGALIEIGRRLGFHRPGLHVQVRSAKSPSSELPLQDTDVKRVVLTGMLFGALAGAAVAEVGILTMVHPPASFPLATMLFSVIAGMLFGGFAGVLFGPISPKLPFERLKELAGDGGLYVTVETERPATTQKAERILRKHAGMVKSA